jgi:Protein of unknown function (DUF3574)
MRLRFHTERAPRASLLLCAAAIVLTIGTTTSSLPAFSIGGGSCDRQVQARLFFGLHGSAGMISEPEWALFLAETVTPRFPDGLTVLQANGQWRGQGNRLEQEPARVVEIVHDDSPDARSRINEIVTIYKARHQQQSVMVTRAHIDVCF